MPLRIICISIFSISFSIFCLFGWTCLPAVAAAPFEYNEDHEQYPYDLETEQSKAKYDARLLSQQFLKAQKSSSESMDGDVYERSTEHDENKNKMGENLDYVDDDDENDGNDRNDGNDNGNDDDLQPHERAASCFTRGHKFTHGQKVPRKDPCEVCLCMDGEIFCWWEKCEKRKAMENLSSTTERAKSRHKVKFSHPKHKRIIKPKMSQVVADAGVAAAADVGANNQPTRQQSRKLFLKKKLSQQDKEASEHREIQLKQQQQEQQEHLKQDEKHQHHDEEKQHNFHHSTSSSSKIMSFPENLPSVLYYDYHTEEHEHHKHQHHQQHLKHQLQKKIQSEREQQQQQQEQQHTNNNNKKKKKYFGSSSMSLSSSLLATSASATASTSTSATETSTFTSITTNLSSKHTNLQHINENAASSAYDETQTDSDILPEPPTKKPKMIATTTTDETTPTPTTAFKTLPRMSLSSAGHVIMDAMERQESNLYDNDADLHSNRDTSGGMAWHERDNNGRQTFIGETLATSSIIARDDVIEINKSVKKKKKSQKSFMNFNDESVSKQAVDVELHEDVDVDADVDTDTDADDAFHRWLTSTETNRNNNNSNKNNKDTNDNESIDNNNYKNNNKQKKKNNKKYNNVKNFAASKNEETSDGLLDENSEFENPFGLANSTINSQQSSNINNNNNSKNNKNNKKNNKKVFNPKDQESDAKNVGNGFLHGSNNNCNGDGDGDCDGDDGGDDNGDDNSSFVNIDILLTTTTPTTTKSTVTTSIEKYDEQVEQQREQEVEQQQQQQQQKQQQKIKTEQLPKTSTSILNEADLILNPSGDDNKTKSNKNSNDILIRKTPEGIAARQQQQQEQSMDAESILSKTNVQFIKRNLTAEKDNAGVSQTTTAAAAEVSTTTTTTTTTKKVAENGVERQCNVMGTLYNIGDVLPQDTGNCCLRCICIDGPTSEDTPRVTCSPHNCPPLVLPDLFDATGY